MPTYNSNLGRWLPDHNPRTPHWAAPLDCGCLGCRIFGMGGDGKPLNTSKDGAVIGLDGKPLAPLPSLPKEQKLIKPDEAVKLDRQVLQCFSESYLAPLLPMTRSNNWEIRRGAITSIARLSDNQLRAAVSALRNLKGQSVLTDVLSYSRSNLCTMPQRREAVLGFVNLVDHRYTHGQLLADSGAGGGSLLHEVLRLLRECQTEPSMRLVVPNVISAIECLCKNDAMAPSLLAGGFASELLAVASDKSHGEGLVALSMRRSAVQALTALSQISEAKVELKKRGALELAVELLDGPYPELASVGSVLTCNLCMHAANKLDVVKVGVG